MAIWYMNMINEEENKVVSPGAPMTGQTDRWGSTWLYHESDTPQSQQTHIGWYWHPELRQYFRWDNYPPHTNG